MRTITLGTAGAGGVEKVIWVVVALDCLAVSQGGFGILAKAIEDRTAHVHPAVVQFSSLVQTTALVFFSMSLGRLGRDMPVRWTIG